MLMDRLHFPCQGLALCNDLFDTLIQAAVNKSIVGVARRFKVWLAPDISQISRA